VNFYSLNAEHALTNYFYRYQGFKIVVKVKRRVSVKKAISL